MEDIEHQIVGDDELNKAAEEIHRCPRKFVPVPRVKKDDKDKTTVNQNGTKREE